MTSAAKNLLTAICFYLCPPKKMSHILGIAWQNENAWKHTLWILTLEIKCQHMTSVPIQILRKDRSPIDHRHTHPVRLFHGTLRVPGFRGPASAVLVLVWWSNLTQWLPWILFPQPQCPGKPGMSYPLQWCRHLPPGGTNSAPGSQVGP